MATWAEVHAHLTATYAEHRDLPDQAVVFAVPLDPAVLAARDLWAKPSGAAGGGEQVTQPVAAHQFEVGGAPWVQILGGVGSAREAQLRALLVANLLQPIGAYCLREGTLVLRLLVPLDGLLLGDLDEAIRAIAYQSTWTRDVLRGAQPP